MAKSPFIIVPELTAIAVGYPQGTLIADKVLPRISVYTKEFRHKKYSLGDDFTVPATLVGRKGAPQQVEFGETEVGNFVEDHGLDVPVPNDDIEAAARARAAGQTGVTDPQMKATGQSTKLLMTAREKRVADQVLNLNNYGTNNKRTLSGTDQWSDQVNSKPQQDIRDALDSMILRPNVAVFGRRVWSHLSTHPKLNAAVFKNGTNAGLISRQQFAEIFELEEVLVGDGWINTAAKGQAPNIVRVWGLDAAFIHRDASADNEFGTTFGYTAQFGDRIGGYVEDPDMGIRGGRRVRAGESVREVLCANDLGFLFKNAAAN